MSSISDRIENIESKIRRLGDQFRAARAENTRLAAENARLREELQLAHQSIDCVSTQLARQKADLAEADANQSPEVLQQQLNQYLKKIDACIESLSNKQV